VDLLRFTTAGSVDDGKSTLIGRLLYDSKSIFEDQLEQVEDASRRRGEEGVNLALLTDGLRAEREQNITIDVAYRYFATPRLKFIIADTPGHIQYTRNMVTGASTAELAIVLIDARNGVLTQSKRHGFIASLLGIPHILVAVNKMDLVDWSEEVFESISREYSDFALKLGIDDLKFMPISALRGDNVVDPSENMPWFDGGTLLHHLESVNLGAGQNLVDFRFPVQYVVRPNQDYRGYAGRVASGSVRPGEDVVVLPSGQRTRIRAVDTFDGPLKEGGAGQSVVLTTEDERDISRGDMLVRPMNLPTVGNELDATVCWMVDDPLVTGKEYWIRHTTRQVKAYVSRLVYRIDVDTLHREEVSGLTLNDIGRVQVTTAQPLFFDRYDVNRETGSFVLIDPHTNTTVGAGMIRGRVHERRNGHGAAIVWMTGLSGSGKSAIARLLEQKLFEAGCQTMLLDGDQVRHGLNGDLGFGIADRKENIRRVAEVAALFYGQGTIVLCTFVSPFDDDRKFARGLVDEGRFFEVFVDTPLEECERRDPKGLYAKARAGEITNMTGIDSPYEPPTDPEVRLATEEADAEALAQRLFAELEASGILNLGSE
jgi:bifunctional enzyme CysN/CysC